MSRATVTTLADGRILIVGGENGPAVVGEAEVFDPADSTFTSIAGPATARADHSAKRLSAGHVLVVGGSDGAAPLASTEIFEPVSNTWSADSSLIEARSVRWVALWGTLALPAEGIRHLKHIMFYQTVTENCNAL
jgi:large repetitive protein